LLVAGDDGSFLLCIIGRLKRIVKKTRMLFE